MKSVLIVDDEADINLSLKVTLEENGFEVNTFDDPIVASDNFKRGKIDSQELMLLFSIRINLFENQ